MPDTPDAPQPNPPEVKPEGPLPPHDPVVEEVVEKPKTPAVDPWDAVFEAGVRLVEAKGWRLLIWPALALAVIVLIGFLNDQKNKSELKVVGYIEATGNPNDDSLPWKVSGQVTSSDGAPVEGALVSMVATTTRGELRSYPLTKSGEDGSFTFTGVNRESKNQMTGPVQELKLSAFLRTSFFADNKYGQETLTVGAINSENLRAKEITFSYYFIAPLICFLVSLLLLACSRTRRVHRLLCLVSLLLTGSMVGVIGYSIKRINESIYQDRTASLGFLNFYRGSYVKEGTIDWLVSLTSPTPCTTGMTAAPPPSIPPAKDDTTPPVAAATSPSTSNPPPNSAPLATGFGAPLWVVFVAALGSGLLTIVLVMRELLRPFPEAVVEQPRPDGAGAIAAEAKAVFTSDQLKEIGKRVRSLIEHQFFVLFSPLGAVIVYQLMLAGGAAGLPVTVAITILGAGATLNGLLVRAVKYAVKWIDKDSSVADDTPPENIEEYAKEGVA